MTPLTPQSVGLLAGVSANYVQAEIRRGHLEALIVQAGKCRRFLVDRQVAQEFAAREQERRRKLKETLIRLFEDTRQPGVCSASGCKAAIDWYRTLNDKGMPMNRGAVPRKSENDPGTKRVIAFFSSSDSHWATCPAAAKFNRR